MVRITNHAANQSYKTLFSLIMVFGLWQQVPNWSTAMTAAHGVVESIELA